MRGVEVLILLGDLIASRVSVCAVRRAERFALAAASLLSGEEAARELSAGVSDGIGERHARFNLRSARDSSNSWAFK